MKNKYSDSLIPLGIGTSYLLFLAILMLAGTGVGYFFKDKHAFPQAGGIILLIIFVILVLLPILYNRKKSPFEKNRVVLGKYDGIGIIQGLRGALFRLIIYKDGIEIRAFYHRYYIPFNKMKRVRIDEGYTSKRLKIETGISGIPNYIVSSGKEFRKLLELIENEKEDDGRRKGEDTQGRE